MLIAVIADTHDKFPSMLAALYRSKQTRADLVIHCGDWKSVTSLKLFAETAAHLKLPVRAVLGNNDTPAAPFITTASNLATDFELTETVMILSLAGRRIAIYHGHHKPTLRRLLDDSTYDIVCLGHTHKPLIEQIANKLIVNPGSTAFAIPRRHGWQPTMAFVETDSLTATIVTVEFSDGVLN